MPLSNTFPNPPMPKEDKVPVPTPVPAPVIPKWEYRCVVVNTVTDTWTALNKAGKDGS
jgi:hypothetical protein